MNALSTHMQRVQSLRSFGTRTSIELYCRIANAAYGSARFVSVAVSMVLLLAVSSEPALAYDGSKYLSVCNNLVGLAEGNFGGMLTVIAGIGAVVASAMGGFKMAWACVVVSVGAFILKGYLQLFFQNCGA